MVAATGDYLRARDPPRGPQPGPQNGRAQDRRLNEEGPARLFIVARSDPSLHSEAEYIYADDSSRPRSLRIEGGPYMLRISAVAASIATGLILGWLSDRC